MSLLRVMGFGFHDKRPTCWGTSCSDAGKKSKTIPFDQITDCDIVEPAGNTCLWIPNTLYQVNINTASSGSDSNRNELTLTGLRDPVAFKKLVWAMKRNGSGSSAQGPSMVNRDGGAVAQQDPSETTAVLLREIRDELRGLRSSSNMNTDATAAVAAATEAVTSTMDGLPLAKHII
jgi:hypothetical protein